MAAIATRDDFKKSGPCHLTAVDWENPRHRRSIAASLVKGVYILERNRQKKRTETEGLASLGEKPSHRRSIGASLSKGVYILKQHRQKKRERLAPLWWESFNFKLIDKLIDKNDNSIFGAIFESNLPIIPDSPRGNPPKFVIAFRGTLLKRKTVIQDLNLDLHIFLTVLNKRSRAKHAIKAVEEIIDGSGTDHPNIWLAGHSLGSALALLAGRNLVIEKGVFLQTYLFNPPLASLPIERMKSKLLKKGGRTAISFFKYGFHKALNAHQHPKSDAADDKFAKLRGWKPHMFVNPRDPICAEYIGYFNNRNTMVKIGAAAIEKIAAEISIPGLLFKLVGRDSEPSHLLPSVFLTINKKRSKKVHGLEQWWKPKMGMRTTLHKI